MKQVTLSIPDKKYPLFMELINSLEYVKMVAPEDEPTKEEVLSGIKQAFNEVAQIKAGKLKSKPIKDLLNEL
jgi:hypothetical protein